jgi:hypothetical protein
VVVKRTFASSIALVDDICLQKVLVDLQFTKQRVKTMSVVTTDLERLVLSTVNKDGSIPNSRKFAQQHGLDHEKVVGTLNSLMLGAEMVQTVNKSEKVINLTKDGLKVHKDKATPEVLFFNGLPPKGEKVEKNAFKKIVGEDVEKNGFGKAKQNKWVDQEVNKEDPKNPIVHYKREVDSVVDTLLECINKLADGKELTADEFKQLKLRKFASEEYVKYY